MSGPGVPRPPIVTTYSLYGTTFSAAQPFPELPVVSSPAEWQFECGPIAQPAGAAWSTIWTLPDGREWLRVARIERVWHFEFANTAGYRVDLDSRTIRGRIDETRIAAVRHLLLDQVFPLVLSLDRTVLHASAAAIDGRAAAFLGPGGTGKSTIAFDLARAGATLIADDALPVREATVPCACPAYPGVRLWDDVLTDTERGGTAAVAEYTTKKRVPLVPFAATPLPLAGIYVMRRGAASPIAPLRPAALLRELLGCAFRLDLAAPSATRAEFTRLSDLALRVRGWVVTVPPDPPRDAIARGVAAHVRERA